MRATTDHRVRRARLLIATAAGGVSGAVAGPLFDLLVPGPFTPSVTVFGAVVGCLAGLLSAVLLNLTLPRTHDGLTRASATLTLTALSTVVVALTTMLLSWHIGSAELLVALIALVVALPASAVVAYSSATART